MKRSTLWILTGVTAAVLIAGGARWASQRKAASPAAPAASAATSLIELNASEVITAQKMDLTVGLPISGTLKASQSAIVKARVAGELMDLVGREGDMVKAGQVIARIDPTEYQARERQAKQQADAAQAQVETAQKQYDNNKALVDQGFISQTALQNSAFSLAQAGERVAPDARIVEVVNLAQLEIEAALPPADASQVRVGMKAQLKVEGLEEPLQAKVLRISPSAQAGSRSVMVYLGVAGEEGLRQGLFAEGTLGTRRIQALAVPLSSVRTDKPQPYVQVVDGDKIKHVTVQTGARAEKTVQNNTLTWVEVQGLAEGAQVLAGSAGAVREGTQVKFTAGVR